MRRRPAKSQKPAVQYLTQKGAEALAEREARAILGVSKEEAFARLDRGELRGTIAEAELTMLRALIQA